MIFCLAWLAWHYNPGVVMETLKVISYIWTGLSVLGFLLIVVACLLRTKEGEVKYIETPRGGSAVNAWGFPLTFTLNGVDYHITHSRENKDGSGAIWFEKERKQKKAKDVPNLP